MAYFLTVETGPRAGMQLQLPNSGQFVLGRSVHADLCLPPDDRTVSRYHAWIEVTSEGIFVRKMQDRAPTLLNGALLSDIGSLKAGDRIQLGTTILRLDTLDRESEPDTGDPSLTNIMQTARTLRQSAEVTVVSLERPPALDTLPTPPEETDEDVLACVGCGRPGVVPPSPELWDAAWLCPQCIEARRETTDAIPQRIGGFDVLRFITSGGMGAVYEAVSADLGLHSAIKVLLPEAATPAKVVHRFLREQRITRALRHPNIVRCYEVGTHEGQPYIAYEFVGGGSALSVASAKSPIREMLWLGADLFRALGYGHDLGVVHRDVKPANLLLSRSGGAGPRGKLSDFGLAKSVVDLATQRITLQNESGGSLLTIGPEQLTNFSEVGPSADIYAGAATVFWLLTRDTPLVLPCPASKANFIQKTDAIMKPERKSLRAIRPDVPRPVAQLIDQLVAYDSSVRERTHAREVAAALGAMASRMARKRPRKKPPPPTSLRGRPAGHLEHPLRLALETLANCIRLLERNVDRTAAEAVRAAFDTQDAERLERAVDAHDQAQSDLETALGRWEVLLSQSDEMAALAPVIPRRAPTDTDG